jgi:antitoxin component of MazEF toxin-antitoxin module
MYKDKKCFKHVVIIPDEVIEKLGWQEGVELERKIDGDSLVIKPTNQNQAHMDKKV